MKAVSQISVDQREQAIFRHLNAPAYHDAGASAREIWQVVSDDLGDSVTVQAYYKLLDRLAATGRLEVVEADVRRYRVAPYLHSGNAVTLDDLYAMLDELKPTEAIAKLVDARQYFEERRSDTLTKAAKALAEEDPRELVEEFLRHKASELEHDIALWGEAAFRDRGLEQRIFIQARELDRFAYRYLGLSRAALDIRVPRPTVSASVAVDIEQLQQELRRRVFGARVLMRVDLAQQDGTEGDWNRRTVAGSDGSTYASVLQLETAQAFVDDVGSQVVTFNNSVAFVPQPPAWAGPYGAPYHSVPMTRSAIDDATNRGMVLAPFMFRYLEPSEYEHMAKCATDVVQWRVDRDVFFGDGRSIGEGRPLATPLVHLRDGTITPQEREWNHYQRLNEYGEMVREGIRLTRQILERIIVRGDSAGVFGGATKTTQTQLFSTLLNWYVSHGSKRTLGAPIDADWDTTRAAYIADNEAMTHLLTTLPSSKSEWWISFAVARPFHSLTEFYRDLDTPDPEHWNRKFEQIRDQQLRELEQGVRSDATWLTGQVIDVRDDDFVWACTNADYVSFYVGHTAGEPPPIVPRYEFLAQLRGDQDEIERKVSKSVTLMVSALDKYGFSADRDHNFMSSKTLTRVVPFVIYDAHEKCKALGRQLERELRSMIVANLQRLRPSIRRDSDISLRPLAIRKFLEKFKSATDDDYDR